MTRTASYQLVAGQLSVAHGAQPGEQRVQMLWASCRQLLGPCAMFPSQGFHIHALVQLGQLLGILAGQQQLGKSLQSVLQAALEERQMAGELIIDRLPAVSIDDVAKDELALQANVQSRLHLLDLLSGVRGNCR